MALNPSWYPLDSARFEGSELMDEESKNVAAASSVANQRLSSPMEGSTIRCISSHGELEVSDSRHYVDRDKPEDVKRYPGQSGILCNPDTDPQLSISVPMERYLNSNNHEDTFVGFDNRGLDARVSRGSLRSRKPSICLNSSVGRRWGPLSVEQRAAAKSMRMVRACVSCRMKKIEVIRTPFWLMNVNTYT